MSDCQFIDELSHLRYLCQRQRDNHLQHNRDMETIGKRVIAAREAKEWRQADLVRESKIPQSTIASIERDKRTSEPSAILIELANTLEVSAYWLKTGKGQRSASPLSPEEQRIVAGFRLMGKELRDSWLATADAKIAEAAKQTKAA